MPNVSLCNLALDGPSYKFHVFCSLGIGTELQLQVDFVRKFFSSFPYNVYFDAKTLLGKIGEFIWKNSGNFFFLAATWQPCLFFDAVCCLVLPAELL